MSTGWISDELQHRVDDALCYDFDYDVVTRTNSIATLRAQAQTFALEKRSPMLP